MDIILNLLKQLATTLSPGEFLVVLCVILVGIFVGVRYVLRSSSKGGKLGSFFSGSSPTEDDIKALQQKVNATVSLEEFAKAIDMIKDEISRHDSSMAKELDNVKNRLELIKQLKIEFDQHNKDGHDETLEIRSTLNNIVQSNNAQLAAINNELIKLAHTLQRTLSQVEKIDEFSKAAVPEFRSYHKELSSNIKDLSRDIALVERSIQTQLNTAHAVKLR